MSDSTGLPQGDPLHGAAVAGRWSFGYDMPDDLGGGFVCGELLLRSDGILLRRYGGSSYRAGQITWKYGPWDEQLGPVADVIVAAQPELPAIDRRSLKVLIVGAGRVGRRIGIRRGHQFQ